MAGKPSLGIFGGSASDVVEWSRRAEVAGFESVWTTEFYDRSAVVPLAAAAHATSRIGVGTGIAYAFGRTPLVLAAEARDLDRLSDGRLRLGLGTGTRRMMQDWLGLDGDHPAPRIEELVPLLRSLWRLHESPVHHEGRFYRLHVEPTTSTNLPVRDTIPIYVAGVNPRMLEAVGAVADGLVGHPLYTPEYVREVVRPALAMGAARAGRPEKVPIAGYLIVSIDHDKNVARRRAAAQIAFYASTKTYQDMMTRHGFADEIAAIRAAWQNDDRDEMVAAVSHDMLLAMAIAGTPDDVLEQYHARWSQVYDTTLLYAPTFGGEASVDLVIDSFANLGS